MQISIDIQGLAELDKLLAKAGKNLPELKNKGLSQMAEEARALAMKRATNINKKGGLAEAIHQERHLDKGYILVICHHIAALFQEFGTASMGEKGGAPYEIKPKNKKALSNHPKDGKPRVSTATPFGPVKKVIHPGVKSVPFMRPAAEHAEDRAVPIFRKLMEFLFK